MRLRRINWGLITLGLVLVGLLIWIAVRGSQIRADERDINHLARTYTTAYMTHILLPESLRSTEWTDDQLDPETFVQLPEVVGAMDETERILRPYFDPRPGVWEATEDHILDAWLLHAGAIARRSVPSGGMISGGLTANQLQNITLELLSYDANPDVIRSDISYGVWLTLQVNQEQMVWPMANVQALKVDDEWKLNSYTSDFVSQIFQAGPY